MCTPKPGQPRTRPRYAPQGEGHIIFKSTLCLQREASRYSAKLPGQQENAKPKCELFVIPGKAKASLLAGCFSRSFRGRLLTLAQQGGSRAARQSRGIQPYLGGRRGKRQLAFAHGPRKTVPAVAAHGSGGGQASPCALGVAARMETAGNAAFNFLRGRERDRNSE